MNKKLEKKLASLPKSPGVYFHKNSAGEIIYIGKAARLNSRVRQYFQKSRAYDAKTENLVAEIADIDWTALESEADALFLEAELIRRYLPPYNILLRDDKSLQFVRIDYKSQHPTVAVVRRPLDDGAEYFGPYINGYGLKKALHYLRRAFPYSTSKPTGKKRASLHYHLGLDPGLEENRTSLEEYRANLRQLMQYLKGNRVALAKQIESDMKRYAKDQEFEKAARARNQLNAIRSLNRQILFGDRELQDASKDLALAQLGRLFMLKNFPKRIEGYDISHMQGTDTVASMVVFSGGVPEKTAYRKFKMRRPGNDDFVHINEAISRRLSLQNQKKWPLPDLILVDGGKGQLSAALRARDKAGFSKIPMIGLAKREEEIIVNPAAGVSVNELYLKECRGALRMSKDFGEVALPPSSPAVMLLQRIRDESHRFARSYHTSLKRTRQTTSVLDQIEGVGEVRKKKLIRYFGSAKAVLQAEPQELETALGKKTGQRVAKILGLSSKDS